MIIVLVNELMTDGPRDGEQFELFFHRMVERARILEERAISNMSWRELASITALIKGQRYVMHDYLDFERKRTLAQKDANVSVRIDPEIDRAR